MAALVDRSTGDVIPASDHNDVKDYIEDGSFRVNTLSLSIGGDEIINSTRHINPVRVVNPDASGLPFYASDGSTQIALLDESGNLHILGNYLKL